MYHVALEGLPTTFKLSAFSSTRPLIRFCSTFNLTGCPTMAADLEANAPNRPFISLSQYLANESHTPLQRRIRWMESIALQANQHHRDGRMFVQLDETLLFVYREKPDNIILLDHLSNLLLEWDAKNDCLKRVDRPYSLGALSLTPGFFHPDLIGLGGIRKQRPLRHRPHLCLPPLQH